MSTPNSSESNKKGLLSIALLRDCAVIAALLVITIKLTTVEFKIDMANFSFNDFLALVLALFSVALSVAFYFKANEASNQFYDNTYKFTKEMSEILGRIEAGFGERLRHLDEGYSGMRERLDRLPYHIATPAEVKEEEEVVKQKENEQRTLLEDLAEKAKLAEHEKQALFANLKQSNEELEAARTELRRLQESAQPDQKRRNRRPAVRYIYNNLINNYPEITEDKELRYSTLASYFRKYRDQLPSNIIDDLRSLDLVNNNNELTPLAAILLRQESRMS